VKGTRTGRPGQREPEELKTGAGKSVRYHPGAAGRTFISRPCRVGARYRSRAGVTGTKRPPS